jgi:succinate dehydrogenase / fumarate reductase cytochrome b subunit
MAPPSDDVAPRTPIPVADRPVVKPRPVYLNLFKIRQPIPAIVSILHRASGALMVLFGIPLGLYAVQSSLASAESFADLKGLFSQPLAKLVLLVFLWAYLHHFFAGIRFLLHDIHIADDLAPARKMSVAVIVVSVLITHAIGARLW